MPANEIKFGDLSGSYYADCYYYGCGNSYDPFTYEVWIERNESSAKAIDYFQIIVSADNVDNSKWMETMIKEMGEDWVVSEQQFNCDPDKYHELARSTLKGSPIQKITIGSFLLEKSDFVRDCEEFKTRPAWREEFVPNLPY